MERLVYADNAATTKMDRAAWEAMEPWLLDEYGNASQPYAFSRKPKKALADARATIADCIGAHPEEIFFTSGGTESDNWVIKSFALYSGRNKTTLTSTFEHHAVLRSCAAIQRMGHLVTYVSPSHEGYLTPDRLERSITDQTGLVSVMLVNNEIGTVQPIGDLCKVAHSHGALFHTDAVQAVGHITVDVSKLGVDFLSASAHKFHGPKGVGFLYIRKGGKLLPYADGGAQEQGLRAGTENVASIVGMAAALRENCHGLAENQRHILRLEQQLIQRLRASGIPYVQNGGDARLPGLLSLSFPGKDGEAVLHRMDLMGICVSTGSACNGTSRGISHVLQAIGLDEEHAAGTIRISLGKNNTEQDVERIASALNKIVKEST